ncbi:hypothetical protein Goklo_008244, partial [Gossypium klotzschianum]|nr:hypothetical protein [Gossypium klotzschianum]
MDEKSWHAILVVWEPSATETTGVKTQRLRSLSLANRGHQWLWRSRVSQWIWRTVIASVTPPNPKPSPEQ